MVAQPGFTAWSPPVEGIVEAFHARLTDHVYPMHAHGSWTLLLIDDGMVKYDLHRHQFGGLQKSVTLLPPHVPHNGAPVTSRGLRKRVLYLDPGPTRLGTDLVGRAVDSPVLEDPALRRRVHQLHGVLMRAGDEAEAENRLAFVTERLRQHLQNRAGPVAPVDEPVLAGRLRDLLDERYVAGITLGEAAGLLHAHPAHLVRAFSGEFGIAPHQYLTGRRVDLARRLLLEDMAPPAVAAAAGFYDQSHLTRHFKRIMGTGPARFARSRPAVLGPPAAGGGTTRRAPG